MLSETQRKKRLIVILVSISFLFVALMVRMFSLQIVQGVELQQKALAQHTRDTNVAPKRGNITDRNGEVLAQSGSADTVVLRPKQIAKAKDAIGQTFNASQLVASSLAPILDMEESEIMEKASDTSKQELWLKRQVTRDQANEIRALNLPGVDFAVDTKRYYPKKDMLTQVLGFTSVDGVGLEGLEKYYDEYLAGTPGQMSVQIDLNDNQTPFSEEYYVPPTDGYTLELSIDYVIQSIIEKQAQDAFEMYNPSRVMCIVMDPNSGQILGMTTKPSYDLNEPPRNDGELIQELSRNRPITDMYDPGSVFKTFTTAAAIESGIANEQSTYSCNGGLTVDGYFIKCHKHHDSPETLSQGLQRSCNPVFMNLALTMGKETFYDYIYKFGFNSKTGVDFSGESTGFVRNQDQVMLGDLARIGFGQSISSSPLQTVAAFSAVVNGGKLYEPTFVNRILKSDGTVFKDHEPVVKSQPISEDTSARMRTLLQGVVDEGSGSKAKVSGYTVGGKTGTTQKKAENTDNPEAISDKHIASFIGFAPVENPQIVVLFIVDEPIADVDYGSTISAPRVGVIIEECLEYLQAPRSDANEDGNATKGVEVPDLMGMPQQEAVDILTKLGLSYHISGEGNVASQMPAPGVAVTAEDEIVLYLRPGEALQEGDVEVPDLSGLSKSECSRLLESLGLKYSGTGEGKAIWQSITPNSKVQEGTTVKVEFKEE